MPNPFVPAINKRRRDKLDRALSKSRITELADWYKRFKPEVRTLRVYSALFNLVVMECHREAVTLGWTTQDGALTYRGFSVVEQR